MPAYAGTAVTEETPGTTSKAMPALTQAERLLGEAVEERRVAVHQPHDEAAGCGLGGPDDELGARRVGQRLAVLAEAGVDDGRRRGGTSAATTASRATWSMTTASAAASSSPARTVSRPGSPGPAPTNDDAGRDPGGGRVDERGGAHWARSVARSVCGGQRGCVGHEVGGAVLEQEAGEAAPDGVPGRRRRRRASGAGRRRRREW